MLHSTGRTEGCFLNQAKMLGQLDARAPPRSLVGNDDAASDRQSSFAQPALSELPAAPAAVNGPNDIDLALALLARV